MRKVRATLFLGIVVLVAAGAVMVSQRNVQAQGAAGPEPAYSTPQLIEKAAANEAISQEEKMLYLLYALKEHTSLPAQYEGTVGWYGTQAMREVNYAYQNDYDSFSPFVQREFDRLLSPSLAQSYCDKDDRPNVDNTSSRFILNYDSTSIGGGLTIGQYVAAMDASYVSLVDSYGWARPPLCNEMDIDAIDDGDPDGPGGNAGLVNPYGKYPVVLSPLGSSLFGYVTTNGPTNVTGLLGDNPFTTIVESDSLASCMVLNEDFSVFPGTPLANLNGTASHEYVHAVQNAWGDPFPFEDAMWAESTAAYFEDEFSDSGNTQYIYLWPTTTNCMGQWPSGGDPGMTSEYSNFIFFRHLAEHNGGANSSTGGEKVIQKFFENLSQPSTYALKALEAAVASETTTTLNQAWHNYAKAVKFSKACGAGYPSPLCFEEGAAYAASNPTLPPSQGAIASPGGNFNGSVGDFYAINYVDLPTGSNYNVMVSNTSGAGNLRGSTMCDTGSTFRVKNLSQVVGPGQTGSIANLDTSGCSSVTLVLTGEPAALPATEPTSCTATLGPESVSGFSVNTGSPTAVEMQGASISDNGTSGGPLLLIGALLLLTALGVWGRRRNEPA